MLVIADATLADGRRRDVRVDRESGVIDAVGQQLTSAERLDARGHRLLPGMIDVHVHFREPGFAHKEDWTTGSQSAAAGGVTTVVDQPNTDPPTVDGAAFATKADLAVASGVDWGLNGGVVPDWEPDTLFDRPMFALGEVFLADSTGEMGISEDLAEASGVDWGLNGGVVPDWEPDTLFDRPLFALGEVFLADSTGEMGISKDLFATAVERATAEDVPVTVHAEAAEAFDSSARDRNDVDAWSAYRTPEAELQAIERAAAIATEQDTSLHIAHTSTPEGVDTAVAAGLTCEVTPHHLFCSRDDLDALGTYGKMNPPLRSEARRTALFDRVADGTVDMIATDHAPHTRAEKDAAVWDAPSGVPGVETALPLLLEAARQGRLGYERVRDLTAANPANRFGLPRKGRVETGRQADLVLVDPDATREIRGDRLHSKVDWTPFEGRAGVFPTWTMVRGEFVYRDGTVSDTGGENVRRS